MNRFENKIDINQSKESLGMEKKKEGCWIGMKGVKGNT